MIGLSGMVALLFGLQFVSMAAMEMSGPFWSAYLRGLVVADRAFILYSSAAYVAPMLGTALSSGFWGRMGDCFGHRAMMARALLGLAVTQGLISITQDPVAIVALRLAQGVLAGYIAPAQAYGTGISSPAERGALFALLQTATNAGSVSGAFFGGLIFDAASFPTINATAALACAACALVVLLCLPQLAPAARSYAAERAVGVSRDVKAVLFLAAALVFARMVMQVPFALYLAGRFGASNTTIGLTYGAMALGFILGAPIFARLARGQGPRKILLLSVGLALACAATTMLIGAVRDVSLFCALYLVWGILLGGTTPLLLGSASALSDETVQGRLMGQAHALKTTGSILAIGLGAWVSQSIGFNLLFPLISALYAACAAGALVLAMRPAFAGYSAGGRSTL
ncbi:MFS transporter [Mameliella alba]|uniref:MFS transporter n=1 Tax=Mameliella alba TaxID=561184 RepID=UPI000B538754|nr:MFS transporter [Mameliella alba]OWV37134.1 MFS transporter [Mameliella alba]